MSRTGTHRRGFTLVELTIVAVIFLVVSGGLLTTFLTGQTSYLSSEAYIHVQQQARQAFDTVVREMREANIDPTGLPGNRLNFRIARGYNILNECDTPAPTICWGNDTTTGAWVHYAIVAGPGGIEQLIRFQTANRDDAPPNPCAAPTCRVMANDVRLPTGAQTPLFAYNAVARTVTFTLQIDYDHPALPGGGMNSPELSSQITLRND